MNEGDREKLDLLSEVIGRFAHDLSNLFATIVLNLNLIESKSADPTAKWFAGSALRAADRGTSLSNRLLAFVGKQTLERTPTDLHGLVSSMRDLLSRTAGPTVELILSTDEELWPVSVDRDQIEFALVNLTENARDAMPRGGRLTIELANVRVTEPTPGLADGEYVAIALEDSGEGLSADTMARAFEPFFSTRRSHEHPGLGLSAVLGIARAHGGSAQLSRAARGGGCRVTLFLPRALEPELRDSADPESTPRQAKQLATVLVVDDDQDLLAVAQEGLASLGCDVLAADSGPAALDKLASNSEVDLLMVDVNLVGMTGLELIRRARELRPGLKALIMTGGDLPGRRQGGDRPLVLSKPFRAPDLARAIAAVLSADSTQ